MLAASFSRYGDISNLQIKEVPTPVPEVGQVLVQIHAAGVNDYEFGLIYGKPYIIRFFLGLRRPKISIPGCDIAGRVVGIGAGVTRWKVGDAVYGDLSGGRFGAFAEFVCCNESQLVAKPEQLSFEQAAAMPQAVVLAMQGLAAGGGPGDGQRLLINGAGGGVGYYAIQLARQKRVLVTGVDSADKLDHLRSLGYDATVDYQQQDFTRLGETWDLIVDTKTFKSPFAYLRALNKGGVYATVGGSMWRILQLQLLGPLLRLLTGKSLRVLVLVPNRNLEACNRLLADGKLHSAALTIYPFADVVRALRFYESARHKGKIVLRMPVADTQEPEQQSPGS